MARIPDRYRLFHEQEGLARLYRTAAELTTEFYHTYWEEPFHPDGEFGPDAHGFGLRTATATAKGHSFFRQLASAARVMADDLVVWLGWERLVLEHEHDLRRRVQAWRALPPRHAIRLPVDPANRKFVAEWFGDRGAVIHDTPQPIQPTVVLPKPLPSNQCLRNVATG